MFRAASLIAVFLMASSAAGDLDMDAMVNDGGSECLYLMQSNILRRRGSRDTSTGEISTAPGLDLAVAAPKATSPAAKPGLMQSSFLKEVVAAAQQKGGLDVVAARRAARARNLPKL
eukprot:gb/GFBE01058763.1/.p1 GENE.gb/GFBE01058763.1/~~gb/GFBE01058763.1/.p1  ORF type:complete len:117 (+),score=21.10 gb/GFBE01058763.1/:1-351(+)